LPLAAVVLFPDLPGGGPAELAVKTSGIDTEVPATTTDPELWLTV
jgi:hypothetical protein